jgi:choline kinase
VVRAHAAEEVNVDVDDEGAFIDIDTPEDYERYIGGPAEAQKREGGQVRLRPNDSRS